MSRRESAVAPTILSAIGGVNQRVRDTELPLHEYPKIEGVFPEFAGLQSRLWGKRLLQKYDEAVYGIHQFWTPQGYGAGLYQFEGTVDYGQWLTPTSNLGLNIPPLGVDGGGFTLDEWGYGYGENFGYGNVNTCTLSFLNGGTDHSVCNPPPSPANTPDDSNGGPAGQGKRCYWTPDGDTSEHSIAGYAVSGLTGQTTFATFNVNPPWNEPYSTVPLPRRPPPIEAGPTKPTYNFSQIRLTANLGSQSLMGAIGSNWFFRYEGGSQCGSVVFDFSPLIVGALPGTADIYIEHRNSTGGPWEQGEWIPVPMNFDGPPGPQRYNSYLLDLWDFMTWGRYEINNGNNGVTTSDEIQVSKIRFNYRVRICV